MKDYSIPTTLPERLKKMSDFLRMQEIPASLSEALDLALFITDLCDASEALGWNFMNDDRLEKIKAESTRILVYIPWKKVVHGSHKTTLSPRIMFAHWSTAVLPTKAVTPSKHSLELEDRHGGFWASDRRGIKPIKGAPTLWMFAPQLPNQS